MSIKSWWKAFWGDDQYVSENGLPPITEPVQMPEVKPCKPEKNISEPVLSFIKLYKENPKRFRVSRKDKSSADLYPVSLVFEYSVFDTENNRLFTAYEEIMIWDFERGQDRWKTGTNTGWATDDELNEVLTVVKEERVSRYKRLKKQRSDIQRERLTKLYKGE